MDQKNTIVKCRAHPNCLFNHNGVCDNYVINIGEDGKCEGYLETEWVERAIQDPARIGLALKEMSKWIEIERGQRAKCNFYEDGWVDPEIVKEACPSFKMSDHLCDIKCVSAHYAEDGELYCALIQDFPERPLRCSTYDDGEEE